MASRKQEMKSILQWGIGFLLGNGMVKGLTMLSGIYLGLVMADEDYAAFGLLLALQGATMVLAFSGVAETAGARLGDDPTDAGRLLLFRQMSGMAVYTVPLSILLLAPMLYSLGDASVGVTAVGAALLLGALTGFATIQAGFLRIESLNRKSLIITLVVAACGLLGLGLGGLWLRNIPLVFVIGAGSAAAAVGVAFLRGDLYGLKVPPAAEAWQLLVRFRPYFLIAGLGWLSGYGFNLVIYAVYDARLIAVFTFLLMLLSINQLIANSFNMVFAPRFVFLYHNRPPDECARLSRLYFSLLAVALGIVGATVVAALPWLGLLDIPNAARFADHQLELALMMSSYALLVCYWQATNYYNVTGSGEAVMRANLSGSVAGFLAWFACLALFGEFGIFVGFLLKEAVMAFTVTALCHRVWRVRPPAVAAVAGCLLVYAGLLMPGPQ